jgi:hypothetical protein
MHVRTMGGLAGGCGVSEGTPPPVANDTEAQARVVLRTANRTQANGSSVRLVVPRAPEVAHEVGVELTEAQLLAVEEYLHHHGYVVPVDMSLSWGTYTITPAGFDWLEGGGMPEPSFSAKDPVLELAERPSEEVALEAALRAELEEEQRRLEEFERELEEVSQPQEWPPRASREAAQESQQTAESHPARGGFRTASERRWWEFWR